MSVALALEFPWQRYHANPWGRHPNEAVVEWPPSPWRLLRAIVATWKERLPGIDEAVMHDLLDALAVPPAYALPPYVEAESRHYYPDVEYSQDKAIDAFVVVPAGAALVVVWDAVLESHQEQALDVIAMSMPYLGRAESLCSGRLLPPEEAEQVRRDVNSEPVPDDVPLGEGVRAVRLLVPDRPIDLDALILRPSEVRSRKLLDPPGASRLRYVVPQPSQGSRPTRVRSVKPRPNAVRFALTGSAPPPRSAAVAVADIMRRACMSWYGTLHDGTASEVLSGKGADGRPRSGHRHAHYLAYSRGTHPRLQTLVVWAPEGFAPGDLAALEAVHALRGHAYVPDFRECEVGVEAIGAVDRVAPELVGPAHRWRSYTPFAPGHRVKRAAWADAVARQVAAELAVRGIGVPSKVRLLRGPWLDYRRHRPGKEVLAQARRATGVELQFDEPVPGPLVLGALCHFGLGLFMPHPDEGP
jgi:CRISPR-associated protein Csb2